MENINRHMLAQLTQEQQIVYTAMMMNPQQIPLFNQNEMNDATETGKVIKEMFKNNIYTSMTLDSEGVVCLK